MKIQIQIIIENEELEEPIVEEVGCLVREELLPETLGMTLEEGKEILSSIQQQMIKYQAKEYVERHRECQDCGRPRGTKGSHEVVWRSVFGKYRIKSPRLYTCRCVTQPEQKSSNPLAQLLIERSSPELLFLGSKWASLMSYGLTAKLLNDVLPIDTNPQTVLLSAQKIAEQIEG